jgi:predicted nucleic acid-binding protein
MRLYSKPAFEGVRTCRTKKLLFYMLIKLYYILNHYPQAEHLIGKKDPKDVPFNAVAFALTVDGTWSNDGDFESQSLFKVWKTVELALNFVFIEEKE